MVRIPDPKPGLVINYAYLWRRESARGQEEGSKDRPAVIVMAVEESDDGSKTVWVAPITHRAPEARDPAIEIPAATKRRLSLDTARSWIVLSEVNRFKWPGPDLRPVGPGKWAYGLLPATLFRHVRDRLAALATERRTCRSTATPDVDSTRLIDP